MDQIQALLLSLGLIVVLVVVFLIDKNKGQSISRFEFMIIILNILLAGGFIYYGLVHSMLIQATRMFLIVGLIEIIVIIMNEVFRYTTRKSIKKDILKFMIYCGLAIAVVGIAYYAIPFVGHTPAL